jgi:hypothetical protein
MSDDSPSLFSFLGDFFKFNFFSGGVSNKESESELRLLLDCVILQKPLLLAEGFVVYLVSSTGQQTRARITSLNDLAVSKSYVTEKGTSLFRRSADELVLGDRIAMPIRKPASDEMEKGKLYVVMRGRLLPQTLLLALENFTNKKLSDGLLFHDLNTENRPRIIKNLAELQPGVVLVRDDATERAEICLLKNGRIRFRFLCASSELTQFLHEGRYYAAAHASEVRSAGDGVPRVFDGSASQQERFEAPEPQALTRRIAQIAANHTQRLRFRGKSSQGQAPGTPHPAESTAQLLSTPRRRERLTPRQSKAVFSAAGHTPPDDGEVIDMVDPRLAMRASPLANYAFRAGGAADMAVDGDDATTSSTAVRRQPRSATTKVGLSSLKQLSSPIEPDTPGISKALYETLVLTSPTAAVAPPAGLMAPPPPPPPPPMKRGAGGAKEKKKRLRALHWNMVGKVDKDSFWGQQMPGDMPGEDVVDAAKLETLFALSPAKKGGEGAQTPRKAAALVASASSRGSIIGIQKSAMLGVLLRGAKLAVTPTDAADALMACDTTVLDAQTLRALADVHSMLDGHEVQQLVAFARAQESSLAGGQSTNGVPLAEQCIAWMLHRVPRVKERIDVLWLRERFADELAHIGAEMEPVERACEQLRTSAKFGGMLRLVFALGSVLNRGSYLAQSSSTSGFRLDSLLRLVDTRGRDKELSLLDYLVSTVHSSMPDLEAFPDELTACDEASRLALTDIMAAAQALCDAVDRAKAEAIGGAGADAVLAAALAPFLERADGEASALKARVAQLRDMFAALCTFFGEDATQPPSTNQFFGNVVKFIADYRASVARLNDSEAKKRRPAPIKKPSARTLRATVLKPVDGATNGRPSPKRTRSKTRLAAIEAAEACDSATDVATQTSSSTSTSMMSAASPITRKRLVFRDGQENE